MKLERNRAERRSKRGVPILYKGIPYLIFAALAAGFLLGAPQLTATSAIAQADKCTVSVLKRKKLPFMFAGYLGKTNSVISRGFQDGDFTYTGSYTWVDDSEENWRLKFLSSGTFIPLKNVVIDAFLVGGGGGGGFGAGSNFAGSGAGGGYTKTHLSISLTKNTAYIITIGAGGAGGTSGNGGSGGTTSGFGYSASGGYYGRGAVADNIGGNGGSGGGAAGNMDGEGSGAGGSNGSNGGTFFPGTDVLGGTGQGTTTHEFGEVIGALYAGGGAGGVFSGTPASAGSGGGGTGGTRGNSGGNGTTNTGGGGGGCGAAGASPDKGGIGGSGIIIIRNAR